MRTKHLLLALSVFIAEILIATVFAGHGFVRGYLGDLLVVILLYHLVKVFYEVAPLRLAVSVFVIACGVELAQYFHLADVLGLPPDSVLSILIGTSFSWADLVAYGLGCMIAYLVDTQLLISERK